MKYKYDGYKWLVRFEKDELLVEGLTKLVKDQNVQGAWVAGLGAAQWAELGFYNLTSKAYQWKRFDQEMEITSLQGNIAWQDDRPVPHLHGTFADKDFKAFGGHIKELQVGGTCEVVVYRWYIDKLNRKVDAQTGLSLLHVE